MSHGLCRVLLQQTMEEVRKHFSPEQIKKVWAWQDTPLGRNQEFHGPNGEYFYNFHGADCLWSIKAEGWGKILDQLESGDHSQ